MAANVVNWSTLDDGDTVDLTSHVLRFDNLSISAADVVVRGPFFPWLSHGDKTVRGTDYEGYITTSNVIFDDGSQLIVGDNQPHTRLDPTADTLNGGARDDQLRGLDGTDSLNGGAGN